MELGLDLRQTQTLSPQMLHSMQILQMGAQELLEYVDELLQENPVLERDPSEGTDDTALLRRKLDWLSSTDVQNRWYHRQDNEQGVDPLDHVAADSSEETLYDHLHSQLRLETLPRETARVLDYLFSSLNSNGWLDESVEELCTHLHAARRTVLHAITLLQTLEPAGVGARDLRECLQLQLFRRGEIGLPLTIVEHYLEDVGRDHYHHIAVETGSTRGEVQAACALIRSLNPRPAAGFADRVQLPYLTPDLIVVRFEHHFELLTNDAYLPSLHLSSYYSRLYRESRDPQVHDYLNGKLRQAKWVVHAMEQRRTTLLRCAECIVEQQEAFFRHGPRHLRPLLLADVAAELEIHESTVSRAVKDKYLQCTHGIFPLSYFFSRSLGSDGNGASPEQAKQLLRTLIDGEDKAHPLSDQKLMEQMAAQGVELSRRTVAKYRGELGIPSTAGRKKF